MMSISLILYRKMYLIRKAEETIQKEYGKDEMKTPMHMSMGEEAIASGVCTALEGRHQVFSTYRSHAVYLAATEDVDGFFIELYGKAGGPADGKAGSMHLADPDKGVVFSSAVVATNIAPALGNAFANRHLGNNKIAVVFFGDGAVDEGVFWESINLACLWKLPVLFVYEDNGLAIHTHTTSRHSYANLAAIVKQFGCHCLEYHGTEVKEIFNMTRSALEHLKFGPVFISLKYYRYLEHVGIGEDFQAGYRSKKEFLKWQGKDPVDIQRAILVKARFENEVIKIEESVLRQIEQAIVLAQNASFPESQDLYKGVYNE